MAAVQPCSIGKAFGFACARKALLFRQKYLLSIRFNEVYTAIYILNRNIL